MRKQIHLMAVPVAVLLAGGCASTPPPVGELSSAHALVSQAEQSDAPRYDSADLTSAQNKLQQADDNAKEHPSLSARLAQQAAVDAELALARTRAHKEQDALQQVDASLAALRSETEQPPAGAVAPNAVPPGGAQP